MSMRQIDATLNDASYAVPASSTKVAVSENVRLCHLDSPLVVEATVAPAATVAAGINLILQKSNDGTTWTDLKTSAVANAFTGIKTQTYFVELAADQTHYPLFQWVRLVATTGVGDAMTVTKVTVVHQA